MRRRLAGACLALGGVGLVLLEIAWTTRDPAPAPLPPTALNAAVFILGLAGLVAVYLGVRMASGR